MNPASATETTGAARVNTRLRLSFVQQFLPLGTDSFSLAVRVLNAGRFDDLSEGDQALLLQAEARLFEETGTYSERFAGPRFQAGAVFGP